jgi:hypothetical protein
MHDADHRGDPRPRRASRRRRASGAAAGLIATALVVAACGGGSGGPGVAGAGSPTSTAGTSGSSGSKKRSALAYSRCMRSHGVHDFPDPGPKGDIAVSGGPGSDLAPDSPVFRRADQACKSLMPPPPGTPAQQRKNFAQALKFAKCMRSHGVQDFTDPAPPGSGPQTQSQKGSGGKSTGASPDSSQFKAAMQACKDLMPGGGGLTVHTGTAGS